MKHQEEVSKEQEALIRGLERQMAQLAKHLAEMAREKAITPPRATEDNLKDNENVTRCEKWKAIIEASEKRATGKETIIKEKPTVRGGNQRQQKPQLP